MGDVRNRASLVAPGGGEATAFVGLGSNLGDRLGALRAAVAALRAVEGIAVEAVSPVYETEAHTLPRRPPQPDHLNAVVRLRTTLAPEALLGVLRALEGAAGRDPDAPRWSPRPLDLDLLLYADRRIETGELAVPHPRLPLRRFVLRPLADLAPALVVPGLGATVADLLARCPDGARIERTAFTLP